MLSFRNELAILLVAVACAFTFTVGGAQVIPTIDREITYQGELVESGVPANGAYDFQFEFFDALTGGTSVYGPSILTIGDVPVDAGEFSVQLLVNNLFGLDEGASEQLWLEIRVRDGASTGAYTVLSPRQAINPAPLAMNIVPPVRMYFESPITHVMELYGDSDLTLLARNLSTCEDCTAIQALNTGGGHGVRGIHSSTSGTRAGVKGETNSTAAGASGVHGEVTSTSPGGVSAGVRGENKGTSGNGIGVYGSQDGSGWGVYGTSVSGTGVRAFSTNGPGLVAQSSTGRPIEARAGGSVLRFYVASNGDVFADGTYQSPAADFAELLPAAANSEPGDVMSIAEDGRLVVSKEAYDRTVVGVHSTQPAFLGGSTGDDATKDGKIPLGVVGIVPVKVCNENGAITPGDMLVASSRPGHAMRACDDAPNGTVIGKALQSSSERSGVIKTLLILQ